MTENDSFEFLSLPLIIIVINVNTSAQSLNNIISTILKFKAESFA